MDIPSIGYGGKGDHDSSHSLKMGYRLFDTDEKSFPFLAEKIRLSGIRDSLCLCLRLRDVPTTEQFNRILEDSRVGYINLLLLIHPKDDTPSEIIKPILRRKWHQMNDLLQESQGRLRHIGVSNFPLSSLRELVSMCQRDSLIKPYVCRYDIAPINPAFEYVRYCAQQKIPLLASKPLGGARKEELLSSQRLQEIAKEIGCTPLQCILVANLRRGIGVLPCYTCDCSSSGSKTSCDSFLKEALESANWIHQMSNEHLDEIYNLF